MNAHEIHASAATQESPETPAPETRYRAGLETRKPRQHTSTTLQMTTWISAIRAEPTQRKISPAWPNQPQYGMVVLASPVYIPTYQSGSRVRPLSSTDAHDTA